MIILSPLTLSSISQKIYDSVTCLPNYKLRNAIKEIENCKILKEELAATQSSVYILENKVELKQQIIDKYSVKDSLYKKNIENLQSTIKFKDTEIFNQKTIITLQNIKIKTDKINKWIYAGAGFFTAIFIKIIFK